MNVFRPFDCPALSARCLADKHVNKMLLEAAQILSSALSLRGIDGVGYKPCYTKHPCVLAAARCSAYYCWTLQHAYALVEERRFRGFRPHKSEVLLPQLDIVTPTPPAVQWPVCSDFGNYVEHLQYKYIVWNRVRFTNRPGLYELWLDGDTGAIATETTQ